MFLETSGPGGNLLGQNFVMGIWYLTYEVLDKLRAYLC